MDSGQDEGENADDTQNSGQEVAVATISEGNGGVVETTGLLGSAHISPVTSSVDRPQDTQNSGLGVAVPSISEGNGGVVETTGLLGSAHISPVTSSVDRPHDTQNSGRGVAVQSISERNGGVVETTGLLGSAHISPVTSSVDRPQDTQNSGQGVEVPPISEGNGGVVETTGLLGSAHISPVTSSVDRPQAEKALDPKEQGPRLHGDARTSVPAGQPAISGHEENRPTGPLPSGAPSTQNITEDSYSSPEDSMATQPACPGKGNEDHSDDDMFMDAVGGPLGNEEASSPSNNRDENKCTQSQSDPVNLKFVAVLRAGITLGPQDKLSMLVRVAHQVELFRHVMNKQWGYKDIGFVFSCSLPIMKEDASHFSYIYHLEVNGKEMDEDLGKPMCYRNLSYRIDAANKDVYLFDDVCMKNQSWWRYPKSTKIDVVRHNFLKAVMLHLMYCQQTCFSDLENIMACFNHCINRRAIWSTDEGQEVLPLNPDKALLQKVLQEAIQAQNQKAPIGSVLVAAAIALTLQIYPDCNSIQHIFQILKHSDSLQGTLDFKASSFLANAVQRIMDMPAARGSQAVWLSALFHTVAPSDHKQKPNIPFIGNAKR
ncbi:uncharacterized protein LOC134454840 [Engraulis encrasicolus]|uniref:uncharacterized protein LOC134454840 n=1 Tax=Engraulis encrasicolus TaxID=184585 RepID=UPI002FD18AAE